MKKISHLAAVITCYKYSDYLRETLPENLHSLDSVVVVTGFDDYETQKLCRELNVECVQTDLFTRKGTFTKAAGINLGLARLEAREWILHLDADIALPRGFRLQVEREYLDKQCIYGADRVHVQGHERWDKHLSSRHVQHSGFFFVDVPKDFPLGTRLLHNQWGYVPIGFFQMWHIGSNKRYPDNMPSAERTDMTFAMQWAEQHRRKLVSAIVYHLDNDVAAPRGSNWHGRTTPPFRPRPEHHCHLHQAKNGKNPDPHSY